MGEPRIIKIFFQLEGWKRNKKKAIALCLFCFVVLASGWEEGDDNVNVISVENLDALLGLRMVTELNLKNLTAPEQRTRRGAPQTENLCEKRECDCETRRRSVSCHFRTEEILDLSHRSLSFHVHHLAISNLTELRIHPGAFSHNSNLLSVTFNDISNITVGKDVFQSLANRPYFNLDVTNCNSLTLHDHSFTNVGCPLRAAVESCDNVRLRKSVFPPTLWLRVTNVPNLEVDSYSFYTEQKTVSARTTADIGFHYVTVKIIPSWTFKLSGARIAFSHSTIELVDKEAFNALQLESVHFYSTGIGRFESEAFSVQTSIKDVEMDKVNVGSVGEQALTAATNITVRNSSIDEISDGAFNVSTAFLKLIGNRFRKIGRHAFSIKSWNSVVIEGNEFEALKQDAFTAPFSKVENVTNEFIFSDNVVKRTEVNALSFVPNSPELDVIIKNNTFREHCHCHLESWMVTLSSVNWKGFYDTSRCRISDFGPCYNLEGEYMEMRNYTAVACGSPVNPDCEIRRVSDYGFPTELDLKNTERTILGVIFLGVASSIAIMLFILSFSWMREKGVCGALSRYVTPSGPCCFAVSRLCNSSNLVTSSSISRINIHEYAEIQYQMTEQQKQTILNGGTDEEVIVICEDKATQTLPEELTQELLQTLREKLDDPENYNEARYMIEHLYDLIKVEESCNNNGSRTSLLLEDEEEEEAEAGDNIYDVITRKPRKRSKKVRKVPSSNLTSTGTRAPSPDKLSPVAFNLPRTTVVTDYAEPRDRKSNEYCELPVSRETVMPDVLAVPARATSHLYAVPLRNMENRPLPSKPGTSDDTSCIIPKCN